jgi:anti-sigma regulatory factor (Ser/Thr protein kinase)
MENRCDYSELMLPNDASYIPVAVSYVREVSKNWGFDENDLLDIQAAVKEAATNTVEHAFEPGERGTFVISCERVSTGIRIIVKDKGMPFDTGRIPCIGFQQESCPDIGFLRMKRVMDEVSLHNLGPEGKEVHLVKHLKNKSIEDYIEACEFSVIENIPIISSQLKEKPNFHVRLMKPEEAIEVSKLAYKAYGYTYAYEHIYYPERMVQLNAEGQIVSAVALTDSGELAGHCAIFHIDHQAGIAEIGQAVVKPEFRRLGCLTSLTAFILKEIQARNLAGFYTRTVTIHSFSQKVSSNFGLKPCAIMLGFAPSDVSFRGITEKLPQRESFVIEFMYLSKPDGLTLYVPDKHRRIVEKIYTDLGTSPQFGMSPESRFSGESQSVLKVSAAGAMPNGYGKIEVLKYGSDAPDQVARRLKELRLQHYEAIGLEVSMSDPVSRSMIPEFEKLGFFFSGVLPGKEIFVLQYLNNLELNYELIKLHSDIGKEILTYTKSQDPSSSE